MRYCDSIRTRLPAMFLASLLLFVLPSFHLGAEAPAAAEDETSVVAAYVVSAGELHPDDPAPRSASDRALHERIWSAVKTIIPGTLLDQVERFELFATRAGKEDSVETDGYASLDEDGKGFVLGLNLESAKPAFIDREPAALAEYEATLLHEFGHVLSLNPGQMEASGGEGGGLSLDEGRLRKDALLNQFYEAFWKKTYPDHGPATSSDAEGERLYEASPSSFVSSYAATGPLEDFAESFSRFALDPKPTGKAGRDLKVLFFYSQPGLPALRDSIRKGLAFLRAMPNSLP